MKTDEMIILDTHSVTRTARCGIGSSQPKQMDRKAWKRLAHSTVGTELAFGMTMVSVLLRRMTAKGSTLV
jgi:hypothetical protein